MRWRRFFAVLLPAADTDFFTDDDGNTFEGDINALAEAGVTKGCNPPENTQYCPDDPVTRGAMAAFLVRGFGYTDASDGDLFDDDDDSIFEDDIDKLGTAGVTEGCNPPDNTLYCPDDPVLRDQMASFLARALDLDPMPPTTTTTTTTTTLAPGEFADFTVSGSGNDVIDFQVPGDVPAVLDITHDGSSNFIVWSLDSEFESIDLLVNEIGSYDGRRPANVGWFFEPDFVRHLEIDADGYWSITARPMSKARALSTSLNGSGDEVVRYEGSASTLTSTHDGSSNFIILGFKADGEYNELIVNEIGTYSGTDTIDSETDILDIQADGNWTLDAP